MYPGLNRAERRLHELARAQATSFADPELRQCWWVLVTAIGLRWIVPEGHLSLQELIDGLEDGGGAGAEEYSIDVDEEDSSRICAVFDVERYGCSLDAMLAELKRLEARRRDRSYRPTESTVPQPLPDPGALRELLQKFLGAPNATPPDSAEVEHIRIEVQERLASLAASPEALASDEMREAVAGLSDTDRTNIASALRAFADWAELPERGGDAVDAAIKLLEQTLGRFAYGKVEDQQATQTRIAHSAQDAIARRLGNPPVDP